MTQRQSSRSGQQGAFCGSTTGEDRPGKEATLLLDFTPNAVHAGVYMAVDRGFDDAEGVSLTVRKPGASTDALKLLLSREPIHGVVLKARRHDIGNPVDWLKTNIVFASRDPKTWEQIAPLLRSLMT